MAFEGFTVIEGGLGAYHDDILRLWSGEWCTKDRSREDLYWYSGKDEDGYISAKF